MNAQPCLIWTNLFRREWHANRPLRPDQLGTKMLSPIRLRCALCDRGMKGHAVEPKQTAIGTESSDNFKPSKHGHRFRGRLTFLDTELLLVRLPDLESGRKSVTSVRSSCGVVEPQSPYRVRVTAAFAPFAPSEHMAYAVCTFGGVRNARPYQPERTGSHGVEGTNCVSAPLQVNTFFLGTYHTGCGARVHVGWHDHS